MSGKKIVHMDIETDIVDNFDVEVGPGNRTKVIKKFMESFSNPENMDIDQIDVRLLEIEVDKINEEISNLREKHEILTTKIDIYTKKSEISEENRLKNIKNHKKNEKICGICESPLSNESPYKTFDTGLICNDCYINTDHKIISEFMKYGPKVPQETEVEKDE